MIHIGKEIHRVLTDRCRTVSWLARQLSCSRTNVYKIFDRPYIDTITLTRISQLLSYDFFQLYSQQLHAEE